MTRQFDQRHIRNFSIIAHIDHGKSTLADRLIEICGALQQRELKAQMLDSMDIERERGITIKAQTVRLVYRAQDGATYQLNLMDTPGHVDFAYEVNRCLAACEGSILVVDATQGVEAQTLANVYHAIDNDHEIIPVLNKIDLPAAEPEAIAQQIEDVIGLDTSGILSISAKTGQGIPELLEVMIQKLPPPEGDDTLPLKALLVDSWYDPYLGVVILVRIKEGVMTAGMTLRMMSNGATYRVDELGFFSPKKHALEALYAGEEGYVIANIKQVADCQVGDTLTSHKEPTAEPLEGFRPSVPVVFCGLFPSEGAEFDLLRESLAKLRLNDASFTFEMVSSSALGFGFRCGFLGLLHLEIVQERLEREFNLDLITTAPSVNYHIYLTDGTLKELHNPADLPDVMKIDHIEEPWIKATILVPDTYLGKVLTLCTERRGVQIDMSYVGSRVMLTYRLPLNEIVFDFYDRLKSLTQGYASFDYQQDGYQTGDVVKLTILINGDPVDALTVIVHRDHAESRGRALCERLKTLIPRQLFKVALQAAIGGKIIARETVSALRKDVTAKCYGGDVSRKRKLLEKQKEGKKRMRQFGNIEIPKSAFIAALKLDDK